MNISLFSLLARSTASSSRSCHDTRVSTWARTKGLLLSPARFLIDVTPSAAAEEVDVVAGVCDGKEDDAL